MFIERLANVIDRKLETGHPNISTPPTAHPSPCALLLSFPRRSSPTRSLRFRARFKKHGALSGARSLFSPAPRVEFFFSATPANLHWLYAATRATPADSQRGSVLVWKFGGRRWICYLPGNKVSKYVPLHFRPDAMQFLVTFQAVPNSPKHLCWQTDSIKLDPTASDSCCFLLFKSK